MFLEIFILAVIIALLVYFAFIFAEKVISPSTPQNSTNAVCINGHCFYVELARTQAEIERGLMGRKELDKNKGMLFVFDKEGIFPFWMKNTLIPLDIIWADSQGKVVYIKENAQPCKTLICPSEVPAAMAKYVLEISAGTVKEANTEIGDTLGINID